MAKAYSEQILCPKCHYPAKRHCVKHGVGVRCNWYWCSVCHHVTEVRRKGPLNKLIAEKTIRVVWP